MEDSIIIYFSRAGENYVTGDIKKLSIGNTEVVATRLQKMIGSNLFKIEPIKEYSMNYNECIAEAQEDLQRNARPELKLYPNNLDKYDRIYLGYPIYWETMPMVLFTFLEYFDFTGKTILPFCTHEGSGFGNSLEDIKKICPSTIVKKGLKIHGANVSNLILEIKNWSEQ